MKSERIPIFMSRRIRNEMLAARARIKIKRALRSAGIPICPKIRYDLKALRKFARDFVKKGRKG